MRNLLSVVIVAFLFSTTAFAQKTWIDVYNILNTGACNSSTCHGAGSSNPSFTVDTIPAGLYGQLINGSPVNPYARDDAHNKLVDPFSPQTSFLMRKLGRCTTNALKLNNPFEGAVMPDNSSPRLTDAELDLIYNWILQGASDTAIINPDTIAGDICDLNVGIRTLPGSDISFAAYPNPAAEKFTCSYTLKSASLVTLELLDVTGKMVKTLFSETQGSGQQRKTIAPGTGHGLYFLRLTVGNEAQYMKKIAFH